MSALLATTLGQAFPLGWTDERIAYLKDRMALGDSWGEIQRRIGGGLSRSALIGKGRRMGFYKPEGASRLRASPKPRLVALRNYLDGQHTPGVIRAPTWIEEPPLAPGEGVQLVDLLPTMCRFPIGDPKSPAFAFCGKPKPDGVPYCGDPSDRKSHMGRAYRPSAASEGEVEKMIRALGRLG